MPYSEVLWHRQGGGPLPPPRYHVAWVAGIRQKGAGREGSALAPRICPADPGHVLLGENRPLAGVWGAPPAWQPPCPSGGTPGPWRALLMGLPQQTAWGRWPSAALAALRRARPLSTRRDQRGRDLHKCRVRNQFGKSGVRLAFSAVFETLVEVSDFREAVLPLRAHFLADRVWVLMPLECRAESIRPCFNSLPLKLRKNKGG